jgi:transglutaminase/protease-like cytokinesis protein 3
MVNQAFPAISAQPALLGLYKQMIEAVVATLPSARQFAAAIDESFKRIEADLAQPEQEQPNPEMIKAQAEVQKNQNEMQIKEQQNAIKEQEVQLKKQAEDNKIMMANKEADMQYQLKMAEIEAGREANANITTGYVRGF